MSHQRNFSDTQLLADGCTALLHLVFGDDNWYRWNAIKQQTQLDSLQSFITWMLDVAEQEITKPTAVFNTPREDKVSFDDYAAAEPLNTEGESGGGDDYGGDYSNTSQLKEDLDLGSEVLDITNQTGISDFHQQETSGINYRPTLYQEGAPSTSSISMGNETSLQIVHDRKTFYCNVCKVSLMDVQVVKEHLNIRHSGEHVTISCYCCSQKFSSVFNFVLYHKRTLPTSARNKHVCNHCARSFNGRQELEDHIANKHLKTGPRHECPFCHKRFSQKCNLSRHKKLCAAEEHAVG